MEWLKLYHDLPSDIKLRRFSSQQKWAWICLLCLASQSKNRGIVPSQDDEDLADFCGFDAVQDYQFFLDKLRQKNMVEPCHEGLKIVNWEARQYLKPSDKPEATRERKRKQREREKQRLSRVTSCDSGVTARDVTPLDPDPERDPDPEKSSRSSSHTEISTAQDAEKPLERVKAKREFKSSTAKCEERFRHGSQKLDYPWLEDGKPNQAFLNWLTKSWKAETTANAVRFLSKARQSPDRYQEVCELFEAFTSLPAASGETKEERIARQIAEIEALREAEEVQS